MALSIVNAETAARDLTAEHRRVAIAAFAAIEPTKLTLDAVARDVAEAHQLTGGVPIMELARAWVKSGVRIDGCPPTQEIVDAFILKLRDEKRDPKYINALRSDLSHFAKRVPDLAAADEDAVRTYLRTLVTKDGAPVSDRRRDNIRDAIVSLSRYARNRRYLPDDRRTAAERVNRLKPGVDVTTYTPEELGLLLEHVSTTWRPLLAIGAFAGMRISEIFRLEWSSIKWRERVIAVRAKVAKKVRVARMVPISDNLLTWLVPFKEHHGPLYLNRKTHGRGPSWKTLEDQQGKEIARLFKATGIAWRENALRHSFGSHRLALLKDTGKLAYEMGTSPAMIRKHYDDPKSEEEAKRYFSILPPEAIDNILPLPLQFG